jgi:hypothetical protein
MNLLEILNTKPAVKWKTIGHRHIGEFSISDKVCQVQLDEYAINFKVLVDFGFIVDGTNKASENGVPASKIIGAVLNSAVPKLQELKPDFILIAVDKTSGLVDSRKNLYDALYRWVNRNVDFVYASPDWIENTKAFYKILGKQTPAKDEIDLFISLVKQK